jgi:hypothetical protein
MAQDIPDPIEPVTGPWKQILTEKAKKAALAQSTKRVRPLSKDMRPHPMSTDQSFSNGKLNQYIAYSTASTIMLHVS